MSTLFKDMLVELESAGIQEKIYLKYLKQFDSKTDWSQKAIEELINSIEYNNLLKKHGRENKSLFYKGKENEVHI